MALSQKQAEQILSSTSDYALHDDHYGKSHVTQKGTLISVEDLGHCLGVPNLEKAVNLIVANYGQILEKWNQPKENRKDIFRKIARILNDQKIPFNGHFEPDENPSAGNKEKFVSFGTNKVPILFEADSPLEFEWYHLFSKMAAHTNGNRRSGVLLKELINMIVKDGLVKEVRLGAPISEGTEHSYVPFVVIDRELVENRAHGIEPAAVVKILLWADNNDGGRFGLRPHLDKRLSAQIPQLKTLSMGKNFPPRMGERDLGGILLLPGRITASIIKQYS